MGLSRHPTTMENFPDEVLSEVFIRLLSKQLAQMRSVSKSWNALLSESSFIKSHLTRSIQTSDGTFMFFSEGFSFDRSAFTVRPSCSPHLYLTNPIKLRIKLRHKYGQGHIIGSVNGLICFYYQSTRDYVIHIWNPSLSAMLTLPTCPRDLVHLHFGFGFDPKTDDYKIVKLKVVSPIPKRVMQCEVYSMRKGFWEPISQSFPSHIEIGGYNNNQVCVADRLHWVGRTNAHWTPSTIVAFDLGGEAYFEMPLPDSILHQVEFHKLVLGNLSGKLCVMSCVFYGECVVWLMGEYGVAGSWVKHHVFPPFSGNIIPYVFILQNEFLFKVDFDDDRLGLYDPISAKTKTFKIMYENTFLCKVVEYVDSLVWIQSTKRETVNVKRKSSKHRFYK